MNKKAIICTAASAALAAYLVFENETLTLTQYEFSSPKVTAELNGVKIVHLSDVHNKRFGKDNTCLVNMITEQQPDIIVISGDLVDSRHTNIDVACNLVERITPFAPTYYVTGNHEERLTDEIYADLLDRLCSIGATPLNGAFEEIDFGSSRLRIAGMFDSSIFTVSTASELFDDGAFNLFVIHRPQYAQAYAAAGADLTFTGHAHGGQMRLPLIGGVIAPDQLFFPKFYEGIHRFGDRATVISRGVGDSFLPRVNNRPEVVVVTLMAK